MKGVLRAAAIVFSLTVFAHADEAVKEFSFRTVDGKIVEYRAANKVPMVINIGAHW